MIGRTLAHYQILEKLGEGGMGVVYKARDTHLDRFVAIKVLPPEKVADPQRKARFVQEAKAASALNHPNIITVHDIDQQDGVDFIVMEYVAGKTLDELIPRKGMRLNEALKHSVEIADALAQAHAAGIIHRDLKPGNVMVGEDGRVRVLDFGLAKLTEAAPLGEDEATRTMRPTTEEGKVVGTVSYMSPEQAEGKRVDARSDIFSFGSVLYEMVTGRRAFQGDSKMSTLGAIIHREPEPLGAEVPQELSRIITRSLRKDPERRFQLMKDIRVELAELKEESDSGTLETVGAPRAKRRWAWMVVSVVAVAVLGAGAWYFLQPKSAAPQRAVVKRLTSDSGLTTSPMLSPDGARVAYASDRDSEGNLDIYIQQVATGDSLRLTQNESDEYNPAFSSDGNRIAYRSEQEGGGIYVVSALGGAPKRIVRGGRRPRFSPDGKQIAYWEGGWGSQTRVEGSLFVIPSEGGQPRRIRADFKRAYSPEWSPDGRHILYIADTGGEATDADVWVTSVDDDRTPAARTGFTKAFQKQGILGVAASLQWIAGGSDGGQVLFSGRTGDALDIWRVSISQRNFRIGGSAEQLTLGAANQANVHA
ncbi:MAG TPA: protein kinase, partial [Bryobacteraceae bacterium]|nr:protein kinase [Bryobacteraceae bacterium]